MYLQIDLSTYLVRWFGLKKADIDGTTCARDLPGVAPIIDF